VSVGADGILLSLLPALFFALGIQCLNRGLAYADSRTGTLIDIATTAVVYWLLAPFYLKTEHWLTWATAIFIAVGLFRPVLSANLALAGVQRLGPTLSSALTATGPLFAALFAVVLLGEQVTLPIAVGTIAVVVGTLVEIRPGRGTREWPLWAMIFPMGATTLRSFAHVLIAFALAIVPEPLFAGLLAYTTSTLVGVLVESRRREGRYIRRDPGLAWFAAGGLMHACAVWSMNAALIVAPVTIVVPLTASSPVFTMLLGVYVFRRETIGARKCLAVLVIVAGVIVITL
jgi:drug/metabolite transporter (DMT)-like permease